jgi:hypothetical protein
MPFVEVITSIKPEGVTWFKDAHPDVHQEIHNAQEDVKDQHGYIETEISNPTENTMVTKRSFVDANAQATFLEFIRNSPLHQMRYQYNLENNITWTIEFQTV